METLLQVQESEISGRLRFIDSEDCWVINEKQEKINLIGLIKEWLDQFDGKRAIFSPKNEEEFYLELDENSSQVLWQKHFLRKENGNNSLKNLLVCLELCLERINGRLIKVELKEDSLKIYPDPSEKVHEVSPERGYYGTKKLSREEVSEICQSGSPDNCCVFLFLDLDKVEWRCLKFHITLGQRILRRLKSLWFRIGNCRLGDGA